jgi:PAS domain S-box-containing protein
LLLLALALPTRLLARGLPDHDPDAWVEHTHLVIEATDRLFIAALDRGLQWRSFLLTGDDIQLRRFDEDTHAIWDAFNTVVGLTQNDPAQIARLSVLGGVLHERQQVIAQSLEAARAGDQPTALAVFRGSDSTVSAGRLRKQILDLVQREQTLLEERQQAAQEAQWRQRLMVASAAALAAVGVLIGLAAWLRVRLLQATARRDAAVQAERQRLLRMMDLATLMVRDFDGTIRYWSAGCERLYGWTAAEAVGRSAHELLRTEFPIPLADVEAIVLARREWSGELRHRTKDGEEVVVRVRKVLHTHAGTTQITESLTDITPLIAAEGALRDSQEHLRAVVATAADGIVVARADGRIVSINPAGLQMFGYDRPEDLIGRDLGDLMPMVEAVRQRDLLAAHQSGALPRAIGEAGRTLLALRRDGTTFPIDLSVSSFGTGVRHFLTGIIRDVSTRAAAEQALRETAARLRLVQQVGNIAALDWLTAESDVHLSAEFRTLCGLPAGTETVALDAWLGLVDHADRARVTAEVEGLAVRERSLATEFRIRRPDRSVRWVTMRAESFATPDGQGRRMIAAVQDITDLVAGREAMEREVAARTAAQVEAESQFRAIFDSQFEFICLLSPDGRLLEANRTALEAGGLDRTDTIGRPFWETGWWPDAERHALRQDIAAAADGTLVRHEVAIRGAEGRSIWIDFSLKPVRDTGNGIVWIIAEGRDITEQRDLAGQLAQAQKVQALGQLAGGIAHDFNNILQTVSGAATLIERRPTDADKARRLARTALDAAERGASITQRLLSFARRGELRVEALATDDVIGGVREVLAHTLDSTITVRAELPAGLPPILSDRGQLETALVNLGTNARDAMPQGGVLTLSAAVVNLPPGMPHSTGLAPTGLTPGGYVRIDVSDTGIGMDSATLARAVEPFFTTKVAGQGTGLGLAMVKGFVEQSGGALSLDSTPGAGTTISLWLRQASAEAAAAAEPEPVWHAEASGAVRVLVVDDDDLVRETLAEQLEAMGFAVSVASSGAEALALIETGETPDALVSDLSMPGLNGVETIKRARALRPHLPCFLLTGYVGERAALESGDAFTLLRKPISGVALAARIEARLGADG